jgi:MATE family, multidrug efflux pump
MSATNTLSGSFNPALHGSPLKGFLKYAIPSALGILAMSTASVIDGIFIGRYEGSDALAAINLVIPIFSMAFGIAFMLAVGGSVVAGKYVGEGNYTGASNIFSKTLIAAIVYGVLLVLAGIHNNHSLFALLGAEPELFGAMSEYFDTLIWFLPMQIATAIYYFFVRIAGYPTLSSAALIIGAVTNLGLDWWFIAEKGYGLQGAALATGISNTVSVSVLLLHLFKTDRWLQFIPLQSQWGELAKAAFNGLSEFVNEISAGLVTLILNLVIINQLGVTGVAAFSVVSYTLFIGLLLSFSMADALQAISSQCYGARNAQRLNEFIKIASAGVIISALGFITLLLTQGPYLIGLFVSNNDPKLFELALEFIHILWPVFIFNGLNVVISTYLTAIHHAFASAIVALLRSLVFPLLWLAVLIQWMPERSIVSALTLAEVCTLVVAAYLFIRYRPSQVLAPTP